MKFVASYSGGKDSVLSIYRAIKAGHEPIALITTCDEKNNHSYFHNIPYSILKKVEASLGIPIIFINTEAGKYAVDFENTLKSLKDKGAELCVFGDIDIQEHYDWCDERCTNAGLKSFFPLWNESRKDLVLEFVDSGFEAIITVLDKSRMNERYLGKKLSREIIDELEADGVDICGENGEYHTFVINGSIFHNIIEIEFGEKTENRNYIRLPIKV